MTRADTNQQPNPFAEFINQHLYLGDETFTPITPPAPTDPRWHYGKYKAPLTSTVYAQPDTRFDYGYSLRSTTGYAHAMLRYLPDIRPGWTAIQITIGNPMIGYVRNNDVSFRRSSGIYEYLLMLMNSALIVVGLSVLIFLYALPSTKTHPTTMSSFQPTAIEQRVERFVARLEGSLLPLQ
ncbi:MAG: hypothetical protein ABI970_08575 [Chloroflexota bacterium]